MSQKLKLNLGCGRQVVKDWINVDYALGARLARLPLVGWLIKKTGIFGVNWDPSIYIHNLTKRFPWADSSIDVVYTSHTLEHLSLVQGKFFLSECLRVLRPGGILRIVVPGLRPIIDDYLKGSIKAEKFLDNLHVLYHEFPGKLKTKLAPFVQYPHKCMYDEESMVRICGELGIKVELKKGFSSAIENIEEIEIDSRVVDAVIAEAVKD